MVFVALLLVLGQFIPSRDGWERISYGSSGSRGAGGPVVEAMNGQAGVYSGAALGLALQSNFRDRYENGGAVFAADFGAALGDSSPLSDLIPTREGLRMYRVKEGDTLSGVAARFSITIDTIRWTNPGIFRNVLRPGDELVILPVSGVLYEVREGDTIEIVANRYQVNPALIKEHNPEHQEIFSTSFGTVILPYAKPIKAPTYAALTAGLPDLGNYFSLPAEGWNWGVLHHYNAVDIANNCGTAVYAAADGLVISDDKLGDGRSGWNGGYGIFVLMEHPNGTRTRYAHLMRSLVDVGDYVYRGDKIGFMGSTGNTHGPTGCHVHFEVYGARNPFAIR